MANELKNCRICGSEQLETVLDLGEIYPSDFVKTQKGLKKEPLALVKCQGCGLVQLKDTVELDTMYKQKYWYRSALNKSMLKDLRDVVESIEQRIELKDNDIVVDIGCNDGSLFDFYSNKNLIKIGYDPAPNLSYEAKEHCTHFINDYFDGWSMPRKAKVVTSIAMFYDLPFPNIFTSNVKSILDENGIWVIQFTDLYSMFIANAFDNICHEHLEYYSLYVLDKLLNKHGLQIEDCEYNKVNGGSLRVYVRHLDYFGYALSVTEKFINTIEGQSKYFIDNKITFESFYNKILEEKEHTLKFLEKCRIENKSIYMLGASTKGNTLLQVFNITNDLIPLAGEVNSDKFGLRTIGSDIEIISEETMLKLKPDYLFVPIWHFIDDILEKDWAKKYMNEGGHFVVPLPEFKMFGQTTLDKPGMDIGEKTTAFLIDELITTSQKCWYAQEDIMDESLSEEKRLQGAIRAQKMNARRNELIRKIDETLGQGHLSPTAKTYYTYFKSEGP